MFAAINSPVTQPSTMRLMALPPPPPTQLLLICLGRQYQTKCQFIFPLYSSNVKRSSHETIIISVYFVKSVEICNLFCRSWVHFWAGAGWTEVDWTNRPFFFLNHSPPKIWWLLNNPSHHLVSRWARDVLLSIVPQVKDNHMRKSGLIQRFRHREFLWTPKTSWTITIPGKIAVPPIKMPQEDQ